MNLGWLTKLDWMVVVLVVGMGVIAWSLYRAHLNPDNAINLVDLVLENGRMSRIAFVFMGTFGWSIWFMVKLELSGRMTEGYFTTFCAVWVTPIIAKLVFATKSDPPVKTP
jgi:hypothetical protein